MTGPLLQKIEGYWPYVALLPVLFYNSVCCLSVGKRFSEDPRTEAQSWIIAHASHGDVLESSAGAPHWKKLPGFNAEELDAADPKWDRVKGDEAVDLRMPPVHGRYELFSKLFPDNQWLKDYAKKVEGQPNEQLFTEDELRKRNPNIVTVYSSDYEVPSQTVKDYYAEMLAGKFGYDIAFDGRTGDPPRWIYPRDIDFLRGRITILTRRPPK